MNNNKKRKVAELFYFYFSPKIAEATRRKKIESGLIYKQPMCMLLNGVQYKYTRKSKRKTKGCIGRGICISPQPKYPKEYYDGK